MEPDKNETPYDENSSCVAESTTNTTTTSSSIDTVQIQGVETIPAFLVDSQLSLKGSVEDSSSTRPEIEAPLLKKPKIGKTCRYKGCLVREGLKNTTCAIHYDLVKAKQAFNRRERYAEKKGFSDESPFDTKVSFESTKVISYYNEIIVPSSCLRGMAIEKTFNTSRFI